MQIVIFFVRIGAAKRIVVFQMQTDTKEVSKWKSRVEKDQQQTHQCKIPSEMEVAPHYNCLYTGDTVYTL